MIDKKMMNFAIEEFDSAWQEFFEDKSEPKDDEEDKKQQEEFYHWWLFSIHLFIHLSRSLSSIALLSYKIIPMIKFFLLFFIFLIIFRFRLIFKEFLPSAIKLLNCKIHHFLIYHLLLSKNLLQISMRIGLIFSLKYSNSFFSYEDIASSSIFSSLSKNLSFRRRSSFSVIKLVKSVLISEELFIFSIISPISALRESFIKNKSNKSLS